MLLLSPQEVLERGLLFVKLMHHPNKHVKKQHEEFHMHYRSSPNTIANIWYDIQTTNLIEPNHKECPEKVKGYVKIDDKEKTEAGFKMFMASQYFLWAYDKNAGLLSSQFNVCEKY